MAYWSSYKHSYMREAMNGSPEFLQSSYITRGEMNDSLELIQNTYVTNGEINSLSELS